ncbi:MAG: DegT/DnrJ/EryC1/StrS family aminotransferase [Phycisphaerales bacterium]|nr:DegT/DnrJ/EryC1/StrS family aminotransferase [Phycisphaerales bacterium]
MTTAPVRPAVSLDLTPAILGGPKAVTLDQAEANRWPIIDADDEASVMRVLRSGELSSGHLPKAMGGYPCPHPEILALECEFAEWMGGAKVGLPVMDVGDLVPQLAGKGFKLAPNVLACNNGTAAILCGLFALGIKPGDEVIVPSTTWWSSVLTVLHVGGVPVFAETDTKTLALDAADVARKITGKTKAVIVTHLFGVPADMDALMDICTARGIKVMEDASHAHGATYNGKPIGLIGDIAVFSLQANKLLPSAEGGFLVGKDPEMILQGAALGQYERLVPLKAIDHPMARFAATGFGYKFRMSPLSAAVARSQMKKTAARTAQRTANCRRLSARLEKLGFDTFMSESGSGTQRVYFEFLVRYDAAKFKTPIKAVAKALQAEGCDVTAPRYPLLHQQPVFTEGAWLDLARLHHDPMASARVYDPADLPKTTAGNGTLLKLPSFPSASDELLDQYAAAFEKVMGNLERLPQA